MTPLCIYLSLGSNLGDRAANLRAAIAALPSANLHGRKVSSFYETEPVDYLDQPWFLNCVVEGATIRNPSISCIPPRHRIPARQQENLRQRTAPPRHRYPSLRRAIARHSRIANPASSNARTQIRSGASRRNRAATPASILAGHHANCFRAKHRYQHRWGYFVAGADEILNSSLASLR